MAEKSRHETLREIENKHLGQCLGQAWMDGRRTLVEKMAVQGTNKTCIVVKQFEQRVPTSSSRPWPELDGVWVYVPIDEQDNTWDELDRNLAAFREKHKIIP